MKQLQHTQKSEMLLQNPSSLASNINPRHPNTLNKQPLCMQAPKVQPLQSRMQLENRLGERIWDEISGFENFKKKELEIREESDLVSECCQVLNKEMRTSMISLISPYLDSLSLFLSLYVQLMTHLKLSWVSYVGYHQKSIPNHAPFITTTHK